MAPVPARGGSSGKSPAALPQHAARFRIAHAGLDADREIAWIAHHAIERAAEAKASASASAVSGHKVSMRPPRVSQRAAEWRGVRPADLAGERAAPQVGVFAQAPNHLEPAARCCLQTCSFNSIPKPGFSDRVK